MGELERQGEDVDTEQRSLGHRRMMRQTDAAAGTSTLIDDIKAKTAELIDICDGLKHDDPEGAAHAILFYEIAELLAVKAATT